VREAVKAGLAEKLEVPITTVTCPEPRQAKAGDVFECKAGVETGGELIVRVTQKDSAGNVSWELVNGDSMLSLPALEAQIKDGIAQQASVNATVSCGGSKLRVSVPGTTFECTAQTPNGPVPIVVTIKDDKGNVTWATK
jgi:hypothetical protein